jgi:hypothetical protein
LHPSEGSQPPLRYDLIFRVFEYSALYLDIITYIYINMPSKKDMLFVIAVYVHENKLNTKMVKYIQTVLQRGKSSEELQTMTKEELWGLVAYFAKDLEQTMKAIGDL